MNQERVIDHQVLKYVITTFVDKRDEFKFNHKEYLEEGEEEFFEYLIKVEISKGWTPQGNYDQQKHDGYGQYRQPMVKYSGFVTSKPPTYIKTRIHRDEKGVPLEGKFEREKYKGDQLISSEGFINGQLKCKGNVKDGKQEGLWEWFDEDGQLEHKGNYKNGKLDGPYETFHENGQLEGRGNFKDGELDGLWEYFHGNGQLSGRGNFIDGKQEGLWEWFDEEGNLIDTDEWKDGKKIGLIKKLFRKKR